MSRSPCRRCANLPSVGGGDAVAVRMERQLAEWEEVGDDRAVFLDCYLHMTIAVDEAIVAGRFRDADWVGRLLDRFADYYFASLDDADAPACPDPWRLAHDAARRHEAGPLQLLLAGVNAHINYDLVLTLVDLLDPEWHDLDADGRTLRRHDYDLVNVVIAETADVVQDRVVERRAPRLDLLDRGLGRWDERLAVRLLSGWRTDVWRHAIAVVETADAAARLDRIARIERRCARRARWLLV